MARTQTLCLAVVLLASVSTACNEPSYQGRKLSSWMADLNSDVDYKRRQACEAIGEMGPVAEKAVPELIKLLEDVNEGVQEFAEEALGKMGPKAMAPLEKVLGRDEPALRLHAAAAIAAIDPRNAEAGEVLVTAVTGIGNAELAEKARGAVIRMKALAVPLLIPKLADPYTPVRLQVIKVLAALKGDAGEAVAPLAKIAKEDKDWKLREAALKAIANIGPLAKVEPVLRASLEDENEQVAAVAGDLLLRIGARDSASGNEGEAEAQAKGEAEQPQPAE